MKKKKKKEWYSSSDTGRGSNVSLSPFYSI